jgi:hypothetical protein
MTQPQNGRRLMRIDGRHDAMLAAGNDILESLLLRFLEQDGDQG